MLLCDREIKELCQGDNPMLSPFVDHQVRYANGYKEDGLFPNLEQPMKVISYGLSSCGYDARLAPEYKVFNDLNGGIIDPLDFDTGVLLDKEGPYCIIPPNSYILGRTVEHFEMPENVVAICVGKSTYARCGIIINCTPIEVNWRGFLTLEISNATRVPAKVYADQGICQIMFYKVNKPDVSYADREGKYMDQVGIVTPRL